MNGNKFSLQANTDTNQVLAKPKSNAGRVASLVHANHHIGAYGFGPCKFCNKEIQGRPILS